MIQDHIYMLFQGMLVGFMASVPLGPIGLICIQRTLSVNRTAGFISGMGAASADTIFAILAAFSLSFIMTFIEDQIYWLKATGGILVIILGLTIFYKRVGRPAVGKSTKGTLLSNYFSIFFLTFTNPAYILIFVALFAATGVKSPDSGIFLNLLLIAGVLVGASSWWFLLTWLINKVRRRFNLHHIWWINKITGIIVVIIGALIILSLMIKLPPGVQRIIP